MSSIIYQHKWMMLCEGAYENPFMDMQPNWGVLTVALTDTDEVVFISEYSVAYDRQVLFLPGGAVDGGEAPEISANRELQEEAGYKAARIDYLGDILPFSKYLRGRLTLYLARDLSPSRLQGDEAWDISIRPVPFADFEGLIAEGELQDSNVIAALYMARSFLTKENHLRG